MIIIKDLHVKTIDEKLILNGINLTINKGEIIGLLGPNGSGKSTLAQVIMGNPGYIITKGSIEFLQNDSYIDITHFTPTERAKLGIFLAFQYPTEIPGLDFFNFLRLSYNSIHNSNLSVFKFREILREKLQILNLDISYIDRNINDGFSGGEKKKMEILQVLLLEPKLLILDEVDSGLDIDSLKLVFESLKVFKNSDNSILVISHYSKVFDYLAPNKIEILKGGQNYKSGNMDLVKEIENLGFNS